MKEKKKKNLAASLLGRKGGQAKLKKYGREVYREMINKRWAKYRAEQAKKDKE